MHRHNIVSLLAMSAFLTGFAAFGGDGEGKARVLEPERIVAGSRLRVAIEFTAGPSGIPVGGGIMMGLHHAAMWETVQTTAPAEPGYATVEREGEGGFDVTWHEWAPKGTFKDETPSGRSDHIHHQVLKAVVTGPALEPGESVRFVFGAGEGRIRAPVSVDPDHPFHLSSDVDGDGVYLGIAEHIYIPIVDAGPHHLIGVVPSTIPVNTFFELQLRAEDEFYNLAKAYEGSVTVLDEDGTTVAENVGLRNGLTRISVRVDTEGPRRFRLSDGTREGRCNPCRAFDELPEHRIYWGDIHGHTSISDGLGINAQAYFEFARDVAKLDVCALTDHGHFDWPQTIGAVKGYYEPGKFVTILAQEAGAGPDHMNLYFREDDAPHIDGWATKYDQFYEMVFAQYNAGPKPMAITGPHHFTYPRGDDRYPFGLFDERSARFVEVYSSHGTSEFLGNPKACNGAKDPEKFLQYGLEQGLRFGVIASSDNHDSHPGRSIWGHYSGGLAAFLSPKLTRKCIFDAFWNRHVYAASFDRVYIEFTIDGQPAGSEVKVSGPCRVAYYVIGQTDALEVCLVRDNEEYRLDKTEDGVVDVAFEDSPGEGTSFYYLRVVQSNGERAWSTPIWVVAGG